jgi:hypothetical protein
MTERHARMRVGEDSAERLGRRGILAWAATLAGAGLAWVSGTRRAEATHLMTGTAGADSAALHVNAANPGTATTSVRGDIAGNPTFLGNNAPGGGIVVLRPDAVQGVSTKINGCGAHGYNHSATGGTLGVLGHTASLSGAGVIGSSGFFGNPPPAGVGVYGLSRAESGVGVRGQIPTGTQANTIAVYAENFSNDAGPHSGAGGFGCYGFSAMGHGLVGATGVLGGGAVVGATNGVVGAHAGIFYGSMVVVGGPKSAAVPHADGTHRLLYCVESTESWFEDFGKATLVRGCATVSIDPEFGAVADMSDYHIFLTPYGRTKGLHVASQTPTAFTVEEHDAGGGEVGFSWRVVAKRKDIAAERLAKVTLPKEPKHPVAPTIVDAPPTGIAPGPGVKRFFVKHGPNEPKHSHK